MGKGITAAARKIAIREILRSSQEVRVPELAARFHVHEMTIRRDLDEMDRSGMVRRIHGGAVVGERLVMEFDFRTQQNAQLKAKRQIAREALRLVQPGMHLILDTGTTTLQLAHLLPGIVDLTVITPSLAVVSLLQYQERIEVVLLGGIVRKGSPDLTGEVTEHSLDLFHTEIAFQGADGIGTNGSIFNADTRSAQVDRRMRERADRTFILADSTKIGRSALARTGYLRDVDALITDSRIQKAQLAKLMDSGANIVIASQS